MLVCVQRRSTNTLTAVLIPSLQYQHCSEGISVKRYNIEC